MTYIISQIFVCITYFLLALTYFAKNRKGILVFNLIALLCNGVHYVLLNAWAGLVVVAVAILRNTLFLIQQKVKNFNKNKVIDWIILIVLLVFSTVMGYITYDAPFDLFSILSSIVFTISVWQKNINIFKILGILSSLLSLAYYIYIDSIFAIILESVLLSIMIVSTIIYFTKIRNNKFETNENLEVKNG